MRFKTRLLGSVGLAGVLASSGVGVSYLVRARAKGLGGRTEQDSVTVISQ